ncbi:ZapG family protein [Kangiella sp. HZ709]|uniref:ZapG family protein n=1 Tax=Kangiella sp. HZ709 TaxID=2666328 RepID=UPI0018A20671|nr:DUF1043 family protein [Kangiella sp. HZ709]
MTTALVTLGIFLALIAGFFAGRWHGMSERSKQLSEELEKKDEELESLKSGVDEHFAETARRFTNLTEEYKELYKHLAKGATELSNQSFKIALSAPSEQLIDHEKVADAEEDSKGEEDTDKQAQQPVDYVKDDAVEDEDSESVSSIKEPSEQESSAVNEAEQEKVEIAGSENEVSTEPNPKS